MCAGFSRQRRRGARRISRVLRRLLPVLAALAFVAIAHAQPVPLAPGLTLGPPRPVSGFRFGGVASGERVREAIPRGDGFLVYEIAGDDLRSVPVDSTGHADTANARVVVPNAASPRQQFTMTMTGSRAVFFWNKAGTLEFSPAPADGGPVRHGTPIATTAQIFGARCNAARCLVKYYDLKLTSRVAIVDLDGRVIATDLAIAGDLAGVDDGGFLLSSSSVGASTYETHLIRIDNDGRQTFDTPLGDAASGSVVALAAPGSSSYAVVWSHSTSAYAATTLYGATLSLDGHLGAPNVLVDGSAASPSAIVSSGSELLLAFSVSHFRYVIPESTQPADLFVQRLSPAAASLAPPVQVSMSPEGNYLAALATNGGVTYVGWNEYTNGGFTPIARGAVLDARANVVAREAFAIGPLPQTPRALAVADDRALAVWSEKDVDRGVTRLLFARAALDGTPLDEQPFVLAEDNDFGVVEAAAIGSDMLVVWTQGFSTEPAELRLRAAIVHAAGSSREEIALPAAFAGSWEAVSPAAVAGNGESWLLAAGGQYVRISRAGIVLTPQPVPFASKSPNWLSIASDGSGFLLVWNRMPIYPVCIDCGGVRSALVNAAGAIVRPEQLAGNGASALDGRPVAAFNGRDYLVVSADHDHLWFRRFAPSGVPLSTAAIPEHHQDGATSVVTRIGTGWFAAWQASDSSAIEGVRITADGMVADAPVALPFIAALASTGSSSALALTTSRIDVPPYGTGSAATLQELTSETVPRRRAAGSR